MSDVIEQIEALNKAGHRLMAAWNRLLDDWVETWHNAPDDGKPLHEFFGMTWDGYGAWAKDATVPARWINSSGETDGESTE